MTDAQANQVIADLFTAFGMPQKFLGINIVARVTAGLVNAVETDGQAAVLKAMGAAVAAAVELAHGKAKP